MFLDDYKELVGKIIEKENPEDREFTLNFLDERIRSMGEYVQSVCDHSMGTARAYAMMHGGVLEPEECKTRVVTLDTARKRKHDVAMDAMNQINRICNVFGMRHICPDDPDRVVRGNFCAAVTSELFMTGTGRDEKAVQAVSKAFSGDTATLDAVVKRVEKGEQIKTEGKKLWESLR